MWRFDTRSETCSSCKRKVKDGFIKVECKGIDYVEKCQRGQVQKLNKSNQLFWSFFERFLSGMRNGMGAWNLSLIKDIIDIYGIEKGQQAIFFDKVLIVVQCIDKINEENKK